MISEKFLSDASSFSGHSHYKSCSSLAPNYAYLWTGFNPPPPKKKKKKKKKKHTSHKN